MGFWPFGGGKKQRATQAAAHEKDTRSLQAPPIATDQDEKMAYDPINTVRPSSRQEETRRSQKLSRHRGLSIKSPASSSKRLVPRTTGESNDQAVYRQNPFSQTSIGPESPLSVHSPPTLHAQRGDRDASLSRQKSAKRKAEDYAREREIRALASAPIPIPRRPGHRSGPFQRESRQIPGGLTTRLERPMSEVSLPIAQVLDDIPDMPNASSYKVSTLAALGPRPTLRYEQNPRAGKFVTRENEAVQRAIAENDVSDTKRIDELADDLNARGLRELLDRDRRRRERKREDDKHKLQRKLQRQEEKQRAEEEARRLRTEAYVRDSPIISSRDPAHDVESPAPGTGATAVGESEPVSHSRPAPIRNPFEDEQDMDYLQDQPMDDDRDESPTPARLPSTEQVAEQALSSPVSPVYQAPDQASYSQGSASVIGREPASEVGAQAPSERRTSTPDERRLSTWTTFFKRGTRRKLVIPGKDRPSQSEFSNTSRESFQRRQISPTVAATRTFRRSTSGTPQRTLSRFREDLPELPISPPDSRIASPEAEQPTPTVAAPSSGHDKTTAPSALPVTLAEGEDAPAVAPLSRAMASVDSEASWLSGRAERRPGAGEGLAARPSNASSHKHARHALSMGDGPQKPSGRDANVEQSMTSVPGMLTTPSDDEDAPGQASETNVAQPSRDVAVADETPLSEVDARLGDDVESPGFDIQDAPLLRARSVDYSRHARHISAGSAKLLDIKRSSTHSDLTRDISRTGSPVQERRSGLRLHDEAFDEQ